jgi:cell filamentation protein
VIHPFREGNARTIKLMTNLLAVQTGRLLLVYDSTEKGQQRYIAAATAAFRKDYSPMAAVIRLALETARKAE